MISTPLTEPPQEKKAKAFNRWPLPNDSLYRRAHGGGIPAYLWGLFDCITEIGRLYLFAQRLPLDAGIAFLTWRQTSDREEIERRINIAKETLNDAQNSCICIAALILPCSAYPSTSFEDEIV